MDILVTLGICFVIVLVTAPLIFLGRKNDAPESVAAGEEREVIPGPDSVATWTGRDEDKKHLAGHDGDADAGDADAGGDGDGGDPDAADGDLGPDQLEHGG